LLKERYRVTYKPKVTLKNLFVKWYDSIDPLKKCGMYRIKCGDCGGVYIGQTLRNFNLRTRENFKALHRKYGNKSN
jgi:hypothetical protein